ncbi:phosphoadenylyl-sulfate reductase [Alkalicoccus chagannorensis]|uniref:phosphoadenylyl-sulfate reductase n=1 Tax=Alkalicoccus chagannorensis TaxID=427072 RepID=UPI00047A7BF6|nr:phosphoadenylyl-sulfate reductase [Alkalicoccus chagannorensis]
MITYEEPSPIPFASWEPEDEEKGARRVIQWAVESYGDELVYACSFGAEAMVMIDMLAAEKPDAQLVFLDTDLHFQETYDLIDRLRLRYPSLRIHMKQPDLSLEEQADTYGSALWKRDPDQCCYIRKVKPLEDALTGAAAWLSGLRRDQSPSRAETAFVQVDHRFRSIKICPFIYWTWQDVWSYIETHKLDYNPLHDQQYPSIGCIPCTTRAADGDSREGRWQGTGKTECGLHR